MMRLVLMILTCLAALPAAANEIIGALSQSRVSLTANFSGSEILLFGAIRHDPVSPPPTQPEERRPFDDSSRPFDIVVVIEGPRQTVSVWRKERRAGIWMNADSATLVSVPSFYAVATTAPLEQIITPETDRAYRISARQAVLSAQGDTVDPEQLEFSQALLRLRQQAEQYQRLDRFVHLEHDILFRANVRLPANLTEGAYTTRMYLVRDGEVVSQYRTAIFVRKAGLERWLHQMAYDQPLLYGLMALAIALIAGWGASALFRFIRSG